VITENNLCYKSRQNVQILRTLHTPLGKKPLFSPFHRKLWKKTKRNTISELLFQIVFSHLLTDKGRGVVCKHVSRQYSSHLHKNRFTVPQNEYELCTKYIIEAVYGVMGGAILENSWEIENTNVQKGYRGGMMCCDHGRDVKFHSAQPVSSCQSKLTALICHIF